MLSSACRGIHSQQALATGFQEVHLTYPEAPTTNHHDLSSFLEYANRKELDPNSSVYVGTHYEYTVANTLAKYGFSLRRTGGRLDGGIDLIGIWSVPSAPWPLTVFLQCKAGGKRGPNLIRELEGSFDGAPAGWRGNGVMGLLVTQQPATPSVRECLGRSRQPMGFISCARSGQMEQFLWNARAQDEGLEGLGVTVRHARTNDRPADLVLIWRGKPVT